jgi:hypothetical protein
LGQLLGEQPVYNVVATLPGAKANEYALLSAHFDSWDGPSGATDNATGTITMLEAMRILKQVLPHPQRTIVAGHWTGEEEGEVGSKAFSEDHPEKGLQGVFNQDNGTGRVMRVGAAGRRRAGWPKRWSASVADVREGASDDESSFAVVATEEPRWIGVACVDSMMVARHRRASQRPCPLA